MQATHYPIQLKNNQEQKFLDQTLNSLFHSYWTGVRGIEKNLGPTRNCGR